MRVRGIARRTLFDPVHDEQPSCQNLTERRRTTVRFLGQQSEMTTDDTWPHVGEMRSLWKGTTEFGQTICHRMTLGKPTDTTVQYSRFLRCLRISTTGSQRRDVAACKSSPGQLVREREIRANCVESSSATRAKSREPASPNSGNWCPTRTSDIPAR